MEKVRSDLEARTNGKWTTYKGCLCFEDDVIGINGFREWINGYGSSVLVIKPLLLREQIIANAPKRLQKYGY